MENKKISIIVSLLILIGLNAYLKALDDQNEEAQKNNPNLICVNYYGASRCCDPNYMPTCKEWLEEL